ncbi:hypothetical protein Tco_0236863, partial [Tanacetum coccineum]
MAMNHLTTFVPEKHDVDAMNYSSWVYYFSHLCHGYGILDHLVDPVTSSATMTPTNPPPKDADVTPLDGAWTEYMSGGVTLLSISSTKHKERPLRKFSGCDILSPLKKLYPQSLGRNPCGGCRVGEKVWIFLLHLVFTLP